MAKCVKQIWICLMIAVLIWFAGVLSDRQQLRAGIIRLHVVAASDTKDDQTIKLQVRDAVLGSIQAQLENVTDAEQARLYLQSVLPKIQETVNSVLECAGVDARAVVTLCKETFDKRTYDTFTLPAGVYESLRIVIGEGKGQNWWCVAFPALCIPQSRDAFAQEAAEAGFSEGTCSALTAEDTTIRFFFLDKLGQLENIFFAG